MAKTKLQLDTRYKRQDDTYSVKLVASITSGARVRINTGVSVSIDHWSDGKQAVIGRTDRTAINRRLGALVKRTDAALLDITESHPKSSLTAVKLKSILSARIFGEEDNVSQECTLISELDRYCETRSMRKNTLSTYRSTAKHIKEYCGNVPLAKITPSWLYAFDAYLSSAGLVVNTRGIIFRCIRAVFNAAIDDEITTNYPFRRFRIKKEDTRKRSLSIPDLRSFLFLAVEDWLEAWRDVFLLSFLLRGINPVDLFGLKDADYKNGRITYKRTKTGAIISVFVEPEAQKIIDKYKGKDGYLLEYPNRYASYDSWKRRLAMQLKKVGKCDVVNAKGKRVYTPLFPDISMYWARHSWATIAISLGVSRDVVGMGLGHSSNTVTDIYIDQSAYQKLVDEANRLVIDAVLKQKAEPDN